MLTPATKARFIAVAQQFIDNIQAQPAISDCNQCLNFLHGHCTVFDSQPPESFYLSDCENWHETVPF